jgi:hypothetical protein
MKPSVCRCNFNVEEDEQRLAMLRLRLSKKRYKRKDDTFWSRLEIVRMMMMMMEIQCYAFATLQ